MASPALQRARLLPGVADPTANAAAILDAANACHEKSVAVAVFPELCLSGYAIEDLLLQDALLDATERALATPAGVAGAEHI
jgi:NAD+ synthase (glutamine-hydrolysing)